MQAHGAQFLGCALAAETCISCNRQAYPYLTPAERPAIRAAATAENTR